MIRSDTLYASAFSLFGSLFYQASSWASSRIFQQGVTPDTWWVEIAKQVPQAVAVIAMAYIFIRFYEGQMREWRAYLDKKDADMLAFFNAERKDAQDAQTKLAAALSDIAEKQETMGKGIIEIANHLLNERNRGKKSGV